MSQILFRIAMDFISAFAKIFLTLFPLIGYGSMAIRPGDYLASGSIKRCVSVCKNSYLNYFIGKFLA